jgi:catechol 2,3-dioxygenase-like lactoylglutathione lyase family enzyme
MSSTDVSGSTGQAEGALGVDMNLEVVTLPVADVDRAKAFYQSLGWRLDIDLVVNDQVRTVQFTPAPLRVLDPIRQGPNDR